MAEYNNKNYRLPLFYDLAISVIRHGHWRKSCNHRTAVALTPGWLRSELMPDYFGVSEATGRTQRQRNCTSSSPETPHYVGRATAHLVEDPEVSSMNGPPLSQWSTGTGLQLYRSLRCGSQPTLVTSGVRYKRCG